jgi:hypothetical protein
MSDYNTPTLSTAYATFLSNLKDRDVDAITLCLSTPSNPPVGTIKWNRASSKFQEWDGAAFQDLILSLAGGGTAAISAAAARTSLGLGDMATQTSSAVNITGGTLAGTGTGLTTLNASNLASGTVPTARLGSGAASSSTYLRGDQTWAALVTVIPYGADQSADFTATIETIYNLTGSHTINLPTVVGNGGKRIGIVNKGTGSWTVDPNGAETILGGLTWSFAYGQYSSALLVADANGLKWDVF